MIDERILFLTDQRRRRSFHRLILSLILPSWLFIFRLEMMLKLDSISKLIGLHHAAGISVDMRVRASKDFSVVVASGPRKRMLHYGLI